MDLLDLELGVLAVLLNGQAQCATIASTVYSATLNMSYLRYNPYSISRYLHPVLLPTEARSPPGLLPRGEEVQHRCPLQSQSDSFFGEYCQNRSCAHSASTWEGVEATRSGRAVRQQTLEPLVYTRE